MGPANCGVIDRVIGSLSSLRKQYNEPPDHTCLAHSLDEFPPGFLESLELIHDRINGHQPRNSSDVVRHLLCSWDPTTDQAVEEPCETALHLPQKRGRWEF